jgi:hypothetical protein
MAVSYWQTLSHYIYIRYTFDEAVIESVIMYDLLGLRISYACFVLSVFVFTQHIISSLFSTATFKYTYRAPLRRNGQEYSANVAWLLIGTDSMRSCKLNYHKVW